MSVRATVRVWDEDEGWGVLDATEAPGGCWCHFSAIGLPSRRYLQSGSTDGEDPVEIEVFEYQSLQPGATVEADILKVEQDGYHFRAESVRLI